MNSLEAQHGHLQMEEAAAARLRSSPHKGFAAVSCVCSDGVLLLRGGVSTFYLKQVAQETVAKVEGAPRVVNEIDVPRQVDGMTSRAWGHAWAAT